MHRHAIRSAAASGALALATSLALTLPANAAETGLEGMVSDPSGAPVVTCVTVYDLDYSWVGSTCTEEDGRWALPDLADGEYKVEVSGTDSLLGEFYEDARDYDSATPVQTPAVLDTVLDPGSTVAGHLDDASGEPAPFTSVEVTDVGGTPAPNGWTSTDDNGDWQVVVPAGDWKVHFSAWPVDQWAYGQTSLESASVITTTAGEVTQVDDRLLPQRTVTGVVTDPAGTPLENVCASVVTPAGYDGAYDFGSGCTDADGRYTIFPYGDPDGPTTVFFQDAADPRVYAPEFAGGSYLIAQAEPVDVSVDAVVDASLERGGVIIGKAVNERRPRGVENVCPSAWPGRTLSYVYGAGAQCSGVDGVYRLTALPPGDYTVRLDPEYRSGYAQEWYLDADSQATATVVTASLGRTTTLRSNRFDPGGTLSGVVTDPTGAPVPDAWVYLTGRNPGRAGPGEGRFSVQTDALGRYAVAAPAGSYRPLVVPPESADLAPQWSGGATTLAAATDVVVRTGRTTSAGFRLVPASRISGEVIPGEGSNVGYVAGQVFTAGGDYIGDFDASLDSGFRFTSSVLPAGRLLLRADVLDADSWEGRTVWFDAATSQSDARPVATAVGATTSVVFRLP